MHNPPVHMEKPNTHGLFETRIEKYVADLSSDDVYDFYRRNRFTTATRDTIRSVVRSKDKYVREDISARFYQLCHMIGRYPQISVDPRINNGKHRCDSSFKNELHLIYKIIGVFKHQMRLI